MTETKVPPVLNFQADAAVSSFDESHQGYLAKHPDRLYGYVATGAIVFDTSDLSAPRILLVQRAANDSMPNRWEVPGGGCDDEDRSILYAVARELREETGLETKRILRLVGDPDVFSSRSGKKICKFNFLVEAATNDRGGFDVTLDAKEHQRFIWATREDVETKKSAEIDLDFTTKELEDTIMAAFEEIEKNS
ncbi:hypothetical protein Hte_004513 [Hypoxylon texense]